MKRAKHILIALDQLVNAIFAGWVLFRKQESKVKVINDINKDVITLYRRAIE
jgi:hypothetical protein